MIKLTDRLEKIILEKLDDSHYSRKIKSGYESYGGKYNFCRFFLHKSDENGKLLSVINQFNSTMVIAKAKDTFYSDAELSELVTLIMMNMPQTIELSVDTAKRIEGKLTDYISCERTEFEYISKNHTPKMAVKETPKLDDVFNVLKTSFPVIAKGYDLWLTDTSHKVRRGLSQCFMLGNYTTATIQYICDNIALVGQVATIPEERGRFHARKLLYWIGEKLNKDGIIVRLFARSNRVSYYEEIGFKELNVDIVFERKDYFE